MKNLHGWLNSRKIPHLEPHFWRTKCQDANLLFLISWNRPEPRFFSGKAWFKPPINGELLPWIPVGFSTFDDTRGYRTLLLGSPKPGWVEKKPWIMLVYVDGLVLLGKSSPETIDFPIKYGAFRFQWSLKPIH